VAATVCNHRNHHRYRTAYGKEASINRASVCSLSAGILAGSITEPRKTI